MKSCFIYKALKGDEVLYVGIADKLSRRFSQHKSYSEWYDLQDTIKVSELPNRRVCKLYETYLIKTLKPKFNKSENNGDDFSLVSFDETNIRWEEYKETYYEDILSPKPAPDYSRDYCEYNETFLHYFKANKNLLSSVEENTYGDLLLTFTFDTLQEAEDFYNNTGVRFRTKTYNLCSSVSWSKQYVEFNILDKSIDKENEEELLLVHQLKEILNLNGDLL
jgi:hypothetical protein